MNNIENNLTQELNQAYNDLNEYTKEANHYNLNTNKTKSIITNIIAAFSLLPSLFLIGPLLSTLNVSFPIITCMSLVTLSSATIGFLSQEIITFISRKINKIPTSTNQEIIEKAMSYELKHAQTEHKIFVIEKTLERIKMKSKLTEKYSSTLNTNNSHDHLTIQELQQKQATLLQVKQTKINELEILTTQQFLNDNFSSYRTKKNRLDKICQNSSIAFGLFSFLIGFPLAGEILPLTSVDTVSEFLNQLGITCIPGIISIPFAAMLTNKNNQDYRNVFNNLNRQLGNNALDIKPNHQLENNLDSLIYEKINELVELSVLLVETTNALNSQQMVNTQPINELNHELSKENIPSCIEEKTLSLTNEETELDDYQDIPLAPSTDLKKRIRKMKSS